MRIIVQNPDNVPDYIIGFMMIGGLPDTGLTVYKTPIGQVQIAVINRRKSRVYFVRHLNNEIYPELFQQRH